MTRLLAPLLLVALAGLTRAQPAPVPADPFAPMNLLLTEQRLAQVRSQLAIGDPLLVRARDQLVAEADAVVARAPNPIVGVLEVPGFYTKHQARQQAITRQLRGDASAAHSLAMAFAVTGDARYADQAEAFLGAWVGALTYPKDGGEWWQVVIDEQRGDTRLVITYAFPHLLYAHDVLRGLGRIDAAEHARFVAWLRPFVDYCRQEVRFKNNHHDWQCLFLAAAAHVTQDRALFDLAMRRLRSAFATKLCPDGALGRELMRGEKAATYTLMALEAVLQTVAIGERHGYAGLRDLTSTTSVLVPPHGPRGTASSRRVAGATLRQAVDHLTDFVLDPQSWQRAHRLLPSTVNGPASRTRGAGSSRWPTRCGRTRATWPCATDARRRHAAAGLHQRLRHDLLPAAHERPPADARRRRRPEERGPGGIGPVTVLALDSRPVIAPDVELFLRLAEANRERGDLAAAVAALSTALERGAGDGDRAAVAAAAERLAAGPPADPATGAARELAARARRTAASTGGPAPAPTPTPAPAPAASAPGPEAPRPAPRRGKKRLVAPELVGSIRDVIGAPQAGADVHLPVIEVVAQLLSADAEVRTTADLALGLVARATGADKAHLVLADAARTAFGLPGGPPRPATTSQGILDEVARTRATVTVGDARRDPRFADRPSIQELQVRSVVAAPVLAEGGEVLVGALYLEGSAGRFGERERGVVEALAGLVGPPLWTARRREEAEHGREKAERLLAREREVREGPIVLGKSPAIVELRRLIDRVSPGEHTVLIEGESGTGKELVARAIHARSGRAEGPFVAENVGALAAGLAEAELFGHERGAFTGADQRRQGLFELAEGGTLLLDEIGEAPLELQAKLLRVLQEREVRPLGGTSSRRVDVRVLAATNRDLAAEVRAGRFREDLYYRLTTIRLRVPPLRERAGDVPLLLEALLAREAAQARRPPPLVPQELQRRLEAHPWPGNVRELQAFAARYLLVGAHDPASTSGAPDAAAPAAAPQDDRGLAISLRMGENPPELREARSAFDKAYLAAVLAKFGGNVTAAAKALNMNRSHLSVLVGRYDLR